jgi:hypothetical protein
MVQQIGHDGFCGGPWSGARAGSHHRLANLRLNDKPVLDAVHMSQPMVKRYLGDPLTL